MNFKKEVACKHLVYKGVYAGEGLCGYYGIDGDCAEACCEVCPDYVPLTGAPD